MSKANQEPISVTFFNLYTLTRLHRVALPGLPHPGDHIYLGELGYEVAYLSWKLDVSGLTELEAMLRPHQDTNGEQIFSYPEEDSLWQRWNDYTLDDAEGSS
ncbi:MAG TPA: hypothetical protein PLD25_31205 [Chloroflexota bacterium]|nr:hypothetical protein [Chloroflexota bacterium]HUM67514.1 hypothetical protein [Chloroflexota bacterium]